MKSARLGKSPPTLKAGYHHGDLPRALVAAALQLIESGASTAPTLRAAAEAAGVSAAAPYRHFESHQALLAATLAEGFRDLAVRMETARSAADTPSEALVATGLSYVRFALARPHLYRAMFGPACDKSAFLDLMTAGHAALGVLHRAVADCRKPMGWSEADVEPTALAGWSLAHGLASLYVDGLLAGSPLAGDLETTADALVRALIEGLRRKPPSGRRR